MNARRQARLRLLRDVPQIPDEVARLLDRGEPSEAEQAIADAAIAAAQVRIRAVTPLRRESRVMLQPQRMVVAGNRGGLLTL